MYINSSSMSISKSSVNTSLIRYGAWLLIDKSNHQRLMRSWSMRLSDILMKWQHFLMY